MNAFSFGVMSASSAITDDEDAGIDEVGLALCFAGAEIDHQAVALLKIHRCAGEIESLVRRKS